MVFALKTITDGHQTMPQVFFSLLIPRIFTSTYDMSVRVTTRMMLKCRSTIDAASL